MKKVLAVLGILLIPLFVMLLGNWRMEAFYNEGNGYYENGEYENAIGKYETALKWYPFEKQECSIRINLALSMIATIDFEQLETKEDIENAIANLKEAKQVLLEKGCAAEEDGKSGHSKEAQKLKQDIDEMIKNLENRLKEQEQNEKDEETETQESQETGEESEETEETEEESLSEQEIQDVEEKLDQIQQQGYEERYEELQEAYEWTNGSAWYYYDGMSW